MKEYEQSKPSADLEERIESLWRAHIEDTSKDKYARLGTDVEPLYDSAYREGTWQVTFNTAHLISVLAEYVAFFHDDYESVRRVSQRFLALVLPEQRHSDEYYYHTIRYGSVLLFLGDLDQGIEMLRPILDIKSTSRYFWMREMVRLLGYFSSLKPSEEAVSPDIKDFFVEVFRCSYGSLQPIDMNSHMTYGQLAGTLPNLRFLS